MAAGEQTVNSEPDISEMISQTVMLDQHAECFPVNPSLLGNRTSAWAWCTTTDNKYYMEKCGLILHKS